MPDTQADAANGLVVEWSSDDVTYDTIGYTKDEHPAGLEGGGRGGTCIRSNSTGMGFGQDEGLLGDERVRVLLSWNQILVTRVARLTKLPHGRPDFVNFATRSTGLEHRPRGRR